MRAEMTEAWEEGWAGVASAMLERLQQNEWPGMEDASAHGWSGVVLGASDGALIEEVSTCPRHWPPHSVCSSGKRTPIVWSIRVARTVSEAERLLILRTLEFKATTRRGRGDAGR